MAVQAAVTTTTRIGVEATAGTAVAAGVQLGSLSIDPSASIDGSGIRPTGYKGDTGAQVNMDMTSIKLAGTPSYPELPYVWSLITNSATPSQPSSAVKTYDWTFRSSTTAADTLKTLTLEQGANATRAQATKNVRLAELDFTFSRRNGCSFSGAGFAQRLEDDKVRYLKITGTGGTFTVTIAGQTTSGVAYNATSGTLQTALEALSTVDSGDVTVTGGPGATAPYRIQIKGQYLNTAMPTITANGGSITGTGAAADLTRLYPSPIEYTVRPVQGTHLAMYFADTYAGLSGASAYTQSFSGGFKTSGRQGEIAFIDSTQESWSDAAEGNPTEEFRLLVANDTEGMALLNKIRTTNDSFVRLLAVGPTIETVSGPITYYHTLRLDACVSWMKIGERTVQDQIVAYEFTGSLRHNATWGYRYEVFVRTNLSALGSAEA